ncbi:ankyrin repeat domain-containing protein [Wolbachia endosymbiont of Zygogramma bicolorata]|uniref:ankyrin repeat domain-containing protein n=1 Tax=Wolbachia endosymbiont of Zygogramma bicolorata TaxID=3134048 RepID=UPI003DA8C6C2
MNKERELIQLLYDYDFSKFKEQFEEVVKGGILNRFHDKGTQGVFFLYFFYSIAALPYTELGKEIKIESIRYKVDDSAKKLKISFKFKKNQQELIKTIEVTLKNTTCPGIVECGLEEGFSDLKLNSCDEVANNNYDCDVFDEVTDDADKEKCIFEGLLEAIKNKKDIVHSIDRMFFKLDLLFNLNCGENIHGYNQEAAQQGFVFGFLMLHYERKYKIDCRVECAAGKGYADLMFLLDNGTKNADPIVVEFKANNGAQKNASKGIEQIKERGYLCNLDIAMKTKSENAIVVGVNFTHDSERVKVESEKIIRSENITLKLLQECTISHNDASIKELFKSLYYLIPNTGGSTNRCSMSRLFAGQLLFKECDKQVKKYFLVHDDKNTTFLLKRPRSEGSVIINFIEAPGMNTRSGSVVKSLGLFQLENFVKFPIVRVNVIVDQSKIDFEDRFKVVTDRLSHQEKRGQSSKGTFESIKSINVDKLTIDNIHQFMQKLQGALSEIRELISNENYFKSVMLGVFTNNKFAALSEYNAYGNGPIDLIVYLRETITCFIAFELKYNGNLKRAAEQLNTYLNNQKIPKLCLNWSSANGSFTDDSEQPERERVSRSFGTSDNSNSKEQESASSDKSYEQQDSDRKSDSEANDSRSDSTGSQKEEVYTLLHDAAMLGKNSVALDNQLRRRSASFERQNSGQESGLNNGNNFQKQESDSEYGGTSEKSASRNLNNIQPNSESQEIFPRSLSASKSSVEQENDLEQDDTIKENSEQSSNSTKYNSSRKEVINKGENIVNKRPRMSNGSTQKPPEKKVILDNSPSDLRDNGAYPSLKNSSSDSTEQTLKEDRAVSTSDSSDLRNQPQNLNNESASEDRTLSNDTSGSSRSNSRRSSSTLEREGSRSSSTSDSSHSEEQESASSYKSYEQQDSNRESNSEKGNSLSNNSNNNSRKRESGSKYKSAEEGASKSLNNVESNSENQEIFSRSSSTSGKNDNDNLSEESCSSDSDSLVNGLDCSNNSKKKESILEKDLYISPSDDEEDSRSLVGDELRLDKGDLCISSSNYKDVDLSKDLYLSDDYDDESNSCNLVQSLFDFTKNGRLDKLLSYSQELPQVRHSNGDTLLHCAVENNRSSLIVYLSNRIDVNSKNKNGKTPLDLAIEKNNIDIVLLLCNNTSGDDIKKKALFTAVNSFNTGIVESLLKNGVNVNIRDSDGKTLLRCTIERNYNHIVKMLLSHGVDINVRDDDGMTPLDFAIGKGSKAIVDLFLNDNNLKDDTRRGALSTAVKFLNTVVIDRLLKENVDSAELLNYLASDKCNITSLYSNAINFHLVNLFKVLLLQKGFEINAEDENGVMLISYLNLPKCSSMVDLLQQKGIEIRRDEVFCECSPQSSTIDNIKDNLHYRSYSSSYCYYDDEGSSSSISNSHDLDDSNKSYDSTSQQSCTDNSSSILEQGNEDRIRMEHNYRKENSLINVRSSSKQQERFSRSSNASESSTREVSSFEHGNIEVASVPRNMDINYGTSDDHQKRQENNFECNDTSEENTPSSVGIGESCEQQDSSRESSSEESCSRSSSPDSQEVEHTASNDISEESSDNPRQDDVYEEEDENSSAQSNSSPESLDELQNDIINRSLDDMGGTILHLFVRIRHSAAINDLINSGANVNAIDKRGFTPLHFAAIKDHHEIVFSLMCKGADVNVKDLNGCTPLEIAKTEEHTECIKHLQSNDLHDVSDNSLSVNSYSELQEFVNFKYDGEYTSLHLAVKSGNVQDVKSLIAIGADVSIKATRYEYTPLYFAVEGGNEEIVKILIEAGADPNAELKESKWTALHYAARYGTAEVVDILIKANANLGAKTILCYTPLYFAVKGGNEETVKILIEAGAGRKAVAEINKTPFSFLVNALDIGTPLPGTTLNNVALDNQLRRRSASF